MRGPRLPREKALAGYSYLGAAQVEGWPYSQAPDEAGLIAGLKGIAAPLIEVAVSATCAAVALVQPSSPQAKRARAAVARRVHLVQVWSQGAWVLPLHLVSFTEMILPRSLRRVISMLVEASAALAALMSYFILLLGS
ncbi:hypothetical protein WJX81_001247 [Elliptochloris bilobata]|uniref:Uncharacterized protein n=1 Tax=Elliptochloris bilobata TaxID=381761 RepID=A0AAW1RQH2_9CHLO